MPTAIESNETLLPKIIEAIKKDPKPKVDWIADWCLIGLFNNLVDSERIQEALELAAVTAEHGSKEGCFFTEGNDVWERTIGKLTGSGYPSRAAELARIYIRRLPEDEVIGNIDNTLEILSGRGIDNEMFGLACDAFHRAPKKERLDWTRYLIKGLGHGRINDNLILGFVRMCSDAMREVPFEKKIRSLTWDMSRADVDDGVIARFATDSVALLPEAERAKEIAAVFKDLNSRGISGGKLADVMICCLNMVPQKERLETIEGMTGVLKCSIRNPNDSRQIKDIYGPGMAFLQYCHRSAGPEYRAKVYGLTAGFVRFLLLKKYMDTVPQLPQYGQWCRDNARAGKERGEWARLSKAFARKGVLLQSVELANSLSVTAQSIGLDVEGAK
jgi:hypothetical protein